MSKTKMRIIHPKHFLFGIILLFNITCTTEIIDYNLQYGKWILIHIENENISTNPLNEIDITFTSDRISGFGGCNNYSGHYKIIEDSLQVSSLHSTFMLCAKNDIMTIENNFLLNLHNSYELKIRGNKLWIYSKNGELEFINEN